MIKTLTISAHRRPDYFAQVVEALERCDGASEYRVTAVLDPSDCTDQLSYIAKCHGISVHIPAQHLGCGSAIRYCMELGFEASEHHIHLEDDHRLPIERKAEA